MTVYQSNSHWMSSQENPVLYPLGIRGDGLEKVAKRWYQEWECRGELRRNLPGGILLAVGINDTARIGREDGRPQLSTDAPILYIIHPMLVCLCPMWRMK